MIQRSTSVRLPLPMILTLLTIGNVAPARAQTGAEAVAAGAAVAGVVLQAIQGLAAWVNDQDDDCYAASLGAAWGKDCNLTKNEEQDTGYWSVYVSSTGDNGCAHGWGSGLAQEGALGSWSSQTITPNALAWTKALHGIPDDKHNAKGWGKAGVDGHCKATEDATPEAARDRLGLDSITPPLNPESVPDTTIAWPPGTFVAVAYISSLTMSATALGTTATSYTMSLTVDGSVVWSGSAAINQAGAATLSGGLSGVPYTVAWNPATLSWDFSLAPFQFSYVIGTLGATKGDATSADEMTASVHLEGEINAEADLSGGASTTYVTTNVPTLHANDSYGVPLRMGWPVQITTPLTVACRPDHFGHQMSDFHLFDPASSMSIGVIDFDWPEPMLPLSPGQRVLVRGIVSQHDGRTVLVDPQISPVGSGPLPPMLTLPWPQILTQPEQFENAGVQLVEEFQYLGTEPVTSGDLEVWLGPNSLHLYLDPDAGPWPTIQPGTRLRPSGFLLQSDPEEIEEGPSNLRARSVASPGYFDGYYLRPRHAGDLVLNTAGVGAPTDPVAGRPRIELAQNRPNPFFPATTIAFRLEGDSDVRLRVFTVAGRLVKTLLDGRRSAGPHEMAWDGTDDDGRALASGLYVYSLEAGGMRETKKMILSR